MCQTHLTALGIWDGAHNSQNYVLSICTLSLCLCIFLLSCVKVRLFNRNGTVSIVAGFSKTSVFISSIGMELFLSLSIPHYPIV